MPKKTLALVFGLVLVTIILFIVALKNDANIPAPVMLPTPTIVQSKVVPTVPAHSVLTLSPNPVIVGAGQRGSIDVNISTSDNAVTAVQLEIAYDPSFITNVKVVPGVKFENPVVIIDRNDPKKGTYVYAFGIMPNRPTVEGVGSVATITFTALDNSGRSQLMLLPTTLVTASGVSGSVLKSSSGTVIEVLSPSAVGASGK